MKLFQTKYFNIGLPLLFVGLLIFLYYYGYTLGINDIPTLIANAIILLLSTLIAISLPLYAAYRNEKQKQDEDTKMVIVAVSRYIGNEILDNKIVIEDIIRNNEKSLKEFTSKTNLNEKAKTMAKVGMWSVASEELVVSLEDKQHQSIVQSGLVSKIADDSLGDNIRSTYQKMSNLRKRLRQLVKFCRLLLNPLQGTPEEFIDLQLKQFTKAVKAVEKDIEIFNKEADITIKEINQLLKPYKKEIKIVEYED